MNKEKTEIEMNFNINQNNQNESHHHVIGITTNHSSTEYFSLMKEKIRRSNPDLVGRAAGKESCCIFKVPQSLFEINPKKPHIFPIGPYNYFRSYSEVIQEQKLRYLGCLISQTRQNDVTYERLFNTVAEMEKQIIESYQGDSDTPHLDSRELCQMMVLDGCFIIELFYMVERIVATDPFFSSTSNFTELACVLLRLDNQIPYFVLQTLFDMTISPLIKENTTTLAKLALEFFNYVFPRNKKLLEKYYSLKPKHLLDLFRLSLIPETLTSPETTQDDCQIFQKIPSAKKLYEVGFEFRPRKTDSFLDIKFKNGILYIPTLTIDSFMWSVIVHCVAFEQCYHYCSKHMTNYVTLMGCLVYTPIDMEILTDHEIISNSVGSDKEVIKFFNGMVKVVMLDRQKNYLWGLFKGVNEYCGKTWFVKRGEFKRTYFSSPWSFFSALAAVILLLLTMVQSFFAIYGYIRPPKQ